MNYWRDYEKVLAVFGPIKKVMADVWKFNPRSRSGPISANKEAVRLIKNFMYARDNFNKNASTGDYMAQLLLLTNIRWSENLRCSHLCLNMQPTILGIAPHKSGDVTLRMPVLSRYQMLSNLLFRARRQELYRCVAVLHIGEEVFNGFSWSNTPTGWIYPGAAAKEILEGLAIRWKNMANFIDEKERKEILLPYEAIWLVQRCVQEYKVRRVLAKCEKILVKKLAEMVFGANYNIRVRPLAAPQSATLDDGSLMTLGLPAVFNANISTLSEMQLSLFTSLKISAAFPSVKWKLYTSGPHPVSRKMLLLDKAC